MNITVIVYNTIQWCLGKDSDIYTLIQVLQKSHKKAPNRGPGRKRTLYRRRKAKNSKGFSE